MQEKNSNHAAGAGLCSLQSPAYEISHPDYAYGIGPFDEVQIRVSCPTKEEADDCLMRFLAWCREQPAADGVPTEQAYQLDLPRTPGTIQALSELGSLAEAANMDRGTYALHMLHRSLLEAGTAHRGCGAAAVGIPGALVALSAVQVCKLLAAAEKLGKSPGELAIQLIERALDEIDQGDAGHKPAGPGPRKSPTTSSGVVQERVR